MTRIFYGCLTAGLIDLLIGGSILTFPYVALSLNLGKMGTISNGIFSLVYIIICSLFSRFRLFKQLRYNLIIGAFLFASGCILMIIVKSKLSLILTPLLLAAGGAFFYPALQSWITEGMGQAQTIKTIANFTISWVVGYLLGPFTAGFILSSEFFHNFTMAQRLDIIFTGAAVISFLVGIFFIPDILKQKVIDVDKRSIPEVFRVEKDEAQNRIKKFIYIIWTANFTAFFLTGLVRFIFTEMGKTENLSPFVIGNVTSVMFLAIIFLTLFLQRYSFWIFSFGYLLFFQLLSLPAIFFFIYFKSVTLYFAGAVIFGFLCAFTFLSSSSYSLMLKGKKDRFININEALIAAGGFLSAVFGYYFSEIASVKYSFLPGIAILFAGIIFETLILLYYPFGTTSSRRLESRP